MNKCLALGTELFKVKFAISSETEVDEEFCTDTYDEESNWASGGGSAFGLSASTGGEFGTGKLISAS